jgi:hypothetical protein
MLDASQQQPPSHPTLAAIPLGVKEARLRASAGSPVRAVERVGAAVVSNVRAIRKHSTIRAGVIATDLANLWICHPTAPFKSKRKMQQLKSQMAHVGLGGQHLLVYDGPGSRFFQHLVYMYLYVTICVCAVRDAIDNTH